MHRPWIGNGSTGGRAQAREGTSSLIESRLPPAVPLYPVSLSLHTLCAGPRIARPHSPAPTVGQHACTPSLLPRLMREHVAAPGLAPLPCTHCGPADVCNPPPPGGSLSPEHVCEPARSCTSPTKLKKWEGSRASIYIQLLPEGR